MKKKTTLKKIIKSIIYLPRNIYETILSYMLPYIYLNYRFKKATGKKLNLRTPSDINEKMFWLARYWQHPLIVKCADKYLVREYLLEKGCGDILNELYGVYDYPEQINFDVLPDSFVIKCNHGWNFNIFCPNKNNLDVELTLKKLNKWIKMKHGRKTAEYQYLNIKPKILCEKYLQSAEYNLLEYQLFCLNGNPMFFLVRNDLGMHGNNTFAISYTIEWERIYYRKNENTYKHIKLEKPFNYTKMIDYAKILAKPFPQVRVDFYEIEKQLIFGELTFSTSNNILGNYKNEVLDFMGSKLILPKKIENYSYFDKNV